MSLHCYGRNFGVLISSIYGKGLQITSKHRQGEFYDFFVLVTLTVEKKNQSQIVYFAIYPFNKR